MQDTRRRALLRFAAAAVVTAAGIAIAFARFPGGYDWAYTVISKLASPRHNPGGGRILAAALLAAMALLWPAPRWLAGGASRGLVRVATAALRAGIAGGLLLGLEGVLVLELSRVARKAHEAIALVTLLGLYAGILGLYAERVRRNRAFLLPASVVLLPMLAIGVTQLLLYVSQRDLGWVDTGWRELGVPVWLSFAFWQWLAVAVLGAGLGHLIATSRIAPASRSA